MDKIFTSLMIGLFCCVWQLSAQQPTFTITPQTANAQVNDVIEFDVAVSDFNDLITFQFGINWNPAVLEFVEISYVNSDMASGFPGLTAGNNGSFSVPGGNVPPGQLGVSWFHPSFSCITRPDGTIAFSFKLRAKAMGTSMVSFAAPPVPSIEVLNCNFVDVDLNPENASVTVGGGTVTPTVQFTIGNGVVQVGQQVCLDVKVSDFTDIKSVQLSINFNSSTLQFASIQGLNLSGLQQSNFNTTTPGQVTLNWSTTNPNGVTVPNQTTIFQICFTGLQAGNAPVTFSNTPLAISVKNKDNADVTFNGQNGSVTVNPMNNTTDFLLTIADATVDNGQSFCVPVTAENFADVVGMSFTINYDPTKLQFQSVQNLNTNLPLFSLGANFGTPNSGLSPGFITVNYFNQSLEGITLPNGAVLFELCFVATGGGGATSDIYFSSDITAIEISDSNQDIIPFNSEPGTITTNGTFDGFRLTVEDQNVAVNEQFCVQVTTENFTDVVGMAFTMNYNATQMQFVSVQNLNPNLPLFAVGANFGTPNSGLSPGFVTVNYFNQSLEGIDLPNGSVLFELCFQSLGLDGTCSDITFSSDITQIEISDSNQDIIPFNSQTGTICVGNVDPNQISLAIGGVTVDLGQAFCLPVRVTNFLNVQNMSFTIEYDETQLEFQSVTNLNGNLPGFTIGGSFGTPASGTQPGVITVSWDGTSGVTLPNDALLFDICFNPIGTDGTCSDVVFASSPTPIEFLNSNQEALTFEGNPGTVCINPAFDGFLLTIQDKVVEPGEQFCVPVTVLNYVDVVGIAFTINYNTSQLQFQQVTNLNTNLPLFSVASNFGNPSPGFVTMSYFNQSLEGINLQNGDVLFEICFTAIGQDGQTSDITFSSAITPIEISDSNQEIIPFNGEEGTIQISAIQPPAIGQPAITNVNCFGQMTGSITVTASGGTGGPFIYSWTGPSGFTAMGSPINNLRAGTYNLTVTDQGSSLTSTASYNVTQPTAAIAVTATPTAPSCNGGSDGTISLNVTGGTPGYTYAWTGGVPSVPNPTGLTAGSYTVTVTDTRGCTQTQTASVPAGTGSPINIAGAVNNVACFGENTGSITLTVTGAQGGATYVWTPSSLSGSSPSGLAPGTYTVTVYDDGGCSRSQSFTVSGPSTTLAIQSITPAPIMNTNDGSVDVTVNGGQGPYIYQWSGPNNFVAATQDIFNLSAPGQYCVTVTDGFGCARTACAMVIRPLRIANADVSDVCFGESNGSINVTITGGAPPYSPAWSTGAINTTMVNNLSGGIYFLTVTDSNNEQITVDFEVEESPEIVLAPSLIPVMGSAGNCNGSIALNATGGTGALTYAWDSGQTSASISNLCVDIYCVTITDQRGCTKDTCFNVFFANPLLEPAVSATNTQCWDTEDGAISININGGLPLYTIQLTDQGGAVLTTASTMNSTYTVNNLPAGTYTVMITDLLGATQSVPGVTISSPAILTASFADYQHAAFGQCNGKVQLTVSGGTAGYTVNWSNGGGTGMTVNNLCGDNYYQATITDANGCEITMEDSIFISIFDVQIASVTGTACPEDADGAVDLTVSGGDPGYTYLWMDENGNTVSQVEDPANLAPGVYTAMVSEPSGNVWTQQITIEATSELAVTMAIESNYNGFDVSCFNSADGQVRATASGSSGYLYEWIRASDNMLVGSGAVLTGAAAGTYQLQVSDVNGCLLSGEVTLESPAPMVVTGNVKDITCHGGEDGSIQVSTTGGIPGFGYNYEWDNGEFDNRLTQLRGGDYSVSVMDANNCLAEATFTVVEPDPISITFEMEPATDGCNGTVQAIVQGGTAPLTYNWINIDGVLNESSVVNLCPGEYFLQVTDGNRCLSELTTAVVQDRRFPCLEERVVITPDGNGTNDQFIIFCVGDYPNNHLEIYNRWGQLVFETDNYDNTWEGTTPDGKPLPEGPYYYILEYTDPDGNLIQQQGSMTILRSDN
ncbi:MAG: gliding motility-associated C-terminal domain-containing protein [Lewinellaceae bacterium]|nr:gliding motility-associated C-terminal domain-containing protein [Lewinellaceae bacterium]